MKYLIRVEHDVYGIWFFSKKSYVAKAIGTNWNYVNMVLKNSPAKIKGFTLEWIEDDGNIISAYLDQPVIFANDKVIRY